MQNPWKRDPKPGSQGWISWPHPETGSPCDGENPQITPQQHQGKEKALFPGFWILVSEKILIGLAWSCALLLDYGSGVNYDWKTRVMGSAWESGVRDYYELSLLKTIWQEPQGSKSRPEWLKPHNGVRSRPTSSVDAHCLSICPAEPVLTVHGH